MPVARTIDLPSHPSPSVGTARRSGTAARAFLVAAIVAVTLALLGIASFGTGSGDGFPDPTHQWTD